MAPETFATTSCGTNVTHLSMGSTGSGSSGRISISPSALAMDSETPPRGESAFVWQVCRAMPLPMRVWTTFPLGLVAATLVTHHPLYLKGVTSVAATSPKGKVVHTLIGNGIALHTCHTNADSPRGGVSESMAKALGLIDIRPLDPDPVEPIDKWVTFVPHDVVAKVSGAMIAAGAGAVGDYDHCTFQTTGIG